MRLHETYQINEATMPPDIKENDIALMTKEEFMLDQNPYGKMHTPTSYDFSLEDMNKKMSNTKSSQNFGDVIVLEKPNGYVVKYNDIHSNKSKPFAVIHDDTAYYTENKNAIPRGLVDRMYGVDIDYGIQQFKRVKYLSEYIEMVDPTDPVTSEYPIVINRKKFGDEYFELRKEERGEHALLAILNEAGQKVAIAQDEWGATLIVVAQEYRGYGLDQWIAAEWYEINPDSKSGGYTPQGFEAALRKWSNRVRKFMANGWYSELIKQGVISKEKVNQIISEIKPRKEYKKPQKREGGNLLLYVDYPSFILYNDRYYEELDPEHIKAFGFIREFDGKTFPYRLEYEQGYEKLAKTIILQLERDESRRGWLMVDEEPSDLLDVNDIEGVQVRRGKARLRQDKLDLDKMSRVETKIRKEKENYSDELTTQLIEAAEYKDWPE